MMVTKKKRTDAARNALYGRKKKKGKATGKMAQNSKGGRRRASAAAYAVNKGAKK